MKNKILKGVVISVIISLNLTTLVCAETSNNLYKVKFVGQEAKYYESINQAYGQYSPVAKDGYIEVNNSIIDIKHGFAKSKKKTNIYSVFTNKILTYVSGGTEFEVVKIEGSKVIISFAGMEGYVKKEDVELIPFSLKKNRSYYSAENEYLYHYIYSKSGYERTLAGKAPKGFDSNKFIYSFDGIDIDEVKYYQYFNYMPLRLQTSYNGSELDAFIKSRSPDSPLIGYGDEFVAAGKKNNVNALYLLAHAIHESGWGKSKIAKEKNNLFGYGAVDESPYQNAYSYNSFTESINQTAEYISKNYLTPGSWLYQGGILGNKGRGMNVMYASDPFWGEKINSIMMLADEYLGKKDSKRYEISLITAGTDIFIFKQGILQKLPELNKDRVVAIVDKISISNETYYQITSDSLEYDTLLIKSGSDMKLNLL